MRLRASKNDLIAIALLLIFTLIYFGQFLLDEKGKVLSSPGGDLAYSGFYHSELGFSLLKKGEAPLWNPYVFCGVPLLAGLQAAFYYPLRWLSFFMEEGRAINISFILHFFLGSLFFYILLRYYRLSPFSSIVASITFSFSAIPVLHLYAGHNCDIWTMIWIPLVILFLDLVIHRPGIIYPLSGGIVLGMQILACHPQHVYYTIFAGTIYLIFHIKKKSKNYYYSLFGKIMLFLTVAMGLSAVQLLPALEMVKHSSRMAGTSLSWIGQNSLPPENFLTILFPGFLGDMISSPYMGRWYLWENCLYLGVSALIFGTMAFLFPRKNRKIYFAFGITALGLFLATGRYNPVFLYLVRFFPGLSLFRGHAKFIYLYGFGLSILAGYGLEYLFKAPSQKKVYVFILAWIAIGLILGVLAISLFPFGTPSPLWEKILSFSFEEGERYGVTPSDFRVSDFMLAYNAMQKDAFMTLSFLGLALLGIYMSNKFPGLKFARIFLAVIVCVDLFIFGQKYLVSFNLENITREKPPVVFLKKDKSFFRTGESIPGLLNRNIYHRFFSVGGYAGNILFRYNLFINLAQRLPLDSMQLALFLKSHSPLMNGLNFKYFLSPSFKRVDHPDFRLVYEDGMLSIYENKKSLPRAYLVPEVIAAASEPEVLERMLSPDFHFLRRAIVENGEIGTWPVNPAPACRGWVKEDASYNTDLTGKVSIIRYESSEVEIDVDTEKESFLVLADMYYPGWEVYINGDRGKIFPTDYIFRGVKIPAGSHNVLFCYKPWSYRIGILITFLAILSLVFGLVFKIFPGAAPRKIFSRKA